MADPAAVPVLERAAARRGLAVTRGGRFHHLVGEGTDKGRAMRTLLTLAVGANPGSVSVGLGDAANDLTLLQAVDRPVIVPRPDGGPDPALAAAMPDAELAPAPGPAGWRCGTVLDPPPAAVAPAGLEPPEQLAARASHVAPSAQRNGAPRGRLTRTMIRPRGLRPR